MQKTLKNLKLAWFYTRKYKNSWLGTRVGKFRVFRGLFIPVGKSALY